MRSRYRFYACPSGDCAKLRSKAGDCPTHSVAMVEVILKREDSAEMRRIRETAARVQQAADRVSPGVGKSFRDILGDLFGTDGTTGPGR